MQQDDQNESSDGISDVENSFFEQISQRNESAEEEDKAEESLLTNDPIEIQIENIFVDAGEDFELNTDITISPIKYEFVSILK